MKLYGLYNRCIYTTIIKNIHIHIKIKNIDLISILPIIRATIIIIVSINIEDCFVLFRKVFFINK